MFGKKLYLCTKIAMMRVFRYILGVLVLVGIAALTACEGKNEQSQDDIPKKKTRTPR